MPSRSQYELLPEDEALEPSTVVAGVDVADAIALMAELRRMTNDIPRGYFARDERIYAVALAGSLSRADIARATGLAKSRVDQIIRRVGEAHRERWTSAGQTIIERHTAS